MRLCRAVAGLSLLLLACRPPWTVRPLQDVEAASTSGQPFDAANFVESIWQSNAVPAAAQAGDFAEWRAGGMSRAALVKAQGRVVRMDETGRRLLVDLAPFDGKADLAVRIGEIRGTALRDALPFIQFSQFVNQVDFARASNALNDRAAKIAAQALGGGAAAGTAIQVGGVAVVPVDGGLPEVIPIFLSRGIGQ